MNANFLKINLKKILRHRAFWYPLLYFILFIFLFKGGRVKIGKVPAKALWTLSIDILILFNWL